MSLRVAAIDVGTNTTRLLIAEEQADGFRAIERRMTVTRLGQGVDERRVLDPEALKRTLLTVADYVATCGELAVDRVRVTGTSAVRDATNSDAFFAGVRSLTGSDPELLTGEAEARATFFGAVSDLGDGLPVLVVDIGGGSTELIVGLKEPERLVSLDIGCVRMLEKHVRSDPPSADELAALRAEVDEVLRQERDRLAVPLGTRLVGVAGTVTQLAALKSGLPVYDPDVTHHLVMSHGDVRLLARRLKGMTVSQRRRIKGLEPGRADVIVPGVEILLSVMEVFDAAEVLVSEKDILDGLVLEMLEDSST